MGYKTKAEKNAFKRGLFVGLFMSQKKTTKKAIKSNKNLSKQNKNQELLEMSERYRSRGLGALLFNGKIYDTNRRGKPVEITKEELAEMRENYGGGRDIDVADRYVYHMRRKFGVFDNKGRFLHLIGEK